MADNTDIYSPTTQGRLNAAGTPNLDQNMPNVDTALATRKSELSSLEQFISRFEPLGWESREAIVKACNEFPQRTSELTFVNLYAWAEIQYPRWAEYKGHVIVSYDPGNTGTSMKFLPPIGPNPVEIMTELYSELAATFVRVDSSQIGQLPHHVPNMLDRDTWDYLYEPSQIQRLEGSQASELRRRCNKLMRNKGEGLTTKPLSNETIPDALIVNDRWLAERLNNLDVKAARLQPDDRAAITIIESDREGKREDASACQRILSKWRELPELQGQVIYYNGEPISFGIGELVRLPNSDRPMLVSHFEKSSISKEYEGLPVYCFQVLCRDLPPECMINRMQSAGVNDLAVWKQSWGPVAMQQKGIVGGDESGRTDGRVLQ